MCRSGKDRITEECPSFRVPNPAGLDFEQNLDLSAQVFSSVQKLLGTTLILSIPVQPGEISGQTHFWFLHMP